MELLAALCFKFPDVATGELPGILPVLPAPDEHGWIVGEDGRKWRLSNPEAVAQRFRKPIPIDVNHSTELKAPKGEESPASGWLNGLTASEGGIQAPAAWNQRGQSQVEGLEYRYLSPVFKYHPDTLEIYEITSVALCNDPNFSIALNQRQQSHEDHSMKLLERLVKALNLKSDANEDEVVAEVERRAGELQTAINHRENPPLEKFVPRADHDAVLQRASNAEQALKDRDQADLEAKVETALDQAIKDRKITPATRDYHKAQCMNEGGLAKFEDYCKNASPVAATPDVSGKPEGESPLSDQQKALCRQLGVSEEDYAKNLTAAA